MTIQRSALRELTNLIANGDAPLLCDPRRVLLLVGRDCFNEPDGMAMNCKRGQAIGNDDRAPVRSDDFWMRLLGPQDPIAGQVQTAADIPRDSRLRCAAYHRRT